MWLVELSDEASRIFESGELTLEDRIVIRKWAELVQKAGPEALQRRPSIWMDHELTGVWKGYRSSRFSYRGRIIYRVEENKVSGVVVKITAIHDYRRKK